MLHKGYSITDLLELANLARCGALAQHTGGIVRGAKPPLHKLRGGWAGIIPCYNPPYDPKNCCLPEMGQWSLLR